MARAFSLTLLLLGVATMAGATLWWALTYWQVWAYDYLSLPQAGKCLVADSTICRLASALCTGQHRGLVTGYSPIVIWIGAVISCCGLWPRQRLNVSTVASRDGD